MVLSRSVALTLATSRRAISTRVALTPDCACPTATRDHGLLDLGCAGGPSVGQARGIPAVRVGEIPGQDSRQIGHFRLALVEPVERPYGHHVRYGSIDRDLHLVGHRCRTARILRAHSALSRLFLVGPPSGATGAHTAARGGACCCRRRRP